MTSRPVRALGVATALTVVMTLLGAVPAEAREPGVSTPKHIAVTAKATGPNHFNSSIDVNLPAGGTARVTSPTVDKNMTNATVEVETLTNDEQTLLLLAFHLAMLPTPGKRITACLTAAFNNVDLDASTTQAIADVTAEAGEQFLLIVFFCLIVAQIVADALANPKLNALGAGAGCAVTPLGIKTKTEKTGSGYTMTGSSNVTAKKKNSKLKVRCKRTGDKYVYSIKPRKKGKKLRSVVGNNLVLGIASPTSATQGAPLKVSFKTP